MAPAETRTLSAASQPDLLTAGRIASGDDDAVEALGIGVAGRLAQLGAALAHALFHPREILELTRVAGERLDLEIHDLADVHDDVRILPLHDVDLAHLVRLELRQQLGEREMVARERVHAIQRDAADDTVVAVRGAELVGAQGVLADEKIGAVAPDLAGDVAAQPARVLDLAVRVAEERHLLDAERARGAALLLLTDGDQPRGGHRAVARALVAVGDDDEADVLTFLDELRHRAARAELAVIGMGGDHQYAPDGIAHALGCLPSNVYLEMPSSSIPIRPRRRAIIGLPMAADRGRRIALIVLVVLLLLPLPAMVLPGSPTAIRIAGVPLLWWYAALVAPLTAAVAVLLSRGLR